MEKRLLALANKERENLGLPSLHFSDGLAGLARRHSADLASSASLSHLSSSGESLQERLVQAGFFFEKAGENIARSETYVADLVHRSLMDSSEHRENILDPSFNTVGIGVVELQEDVYFVTQDFIQSVERLSPEAAKARIIEMIRKWRSARLLLPLVFNEDAGRLAQEFAEAKAADRQTPSLSGLGQEIHLDIVVTPALERLDEHSLRIDDPIYEDAGLGVSFGRLKEFPGGAYCVAVALLPKNRYISLTDGERGEIIRKAVNSVRQKSGLPGLEVNEDLAHEAARIALHISRGGSSASLSVSGPLRVTVFSFRGNNLEQIPLELESIVLAPHLHSIGAYALFVRPKKLPRGEYLVIVIVG